MLTKDLIRSSVRAGKIYPHFIDPKDNRWEIVSAELLDVFQNNIGETAENIEIFCKDVLLRAPDLKVARGLLKIIRSRAIFSGEEDKFNYAEFREKLFQKTAQMLKSGQLPHDIHAVKQTVFAELQRDGITQMPPRDIYGDMPEKEVLLKFRTTFANECPDRYNVALVQGILLTADAMDITIPTTTPPADLRNLLRDIRFFQLLFSGFEANEKILLHIDGPASIFENSLKYGLQFACFFPSICRLPQWTLDARVKKKDKPFMLSLSEKDGLKSHRAQFSGPVEEYRMFFDYFKTQETNWEINDQPGFLNADAQELIFPDFAFTSKVTPEKTFFLELFHRWHSSQVDNRLKWISEHSDFPLIIGIDRALLKKDGVLKNKLENHPLYKKKIFLFRDFPGVENICKLLDSATSQSTENLNFDF